MDFVLFFSVIVPFTLHSFVEFEQSLKFCNLLCSVLCRFVSLGSISFINRH